MKKGAIKAVAFDMDGLLINTEDIYADAVKVLLCRRGKAYCDIVRRKLVGLSAKEACEILIQTEGLKTTWQDLLQEIDSIFEELSENRLELNEGVLTTLDFIESIKIPKCIATNASVKFAQHALSSVGVYERFDFILTAEEAGKSKPHPAIYKLAAEKFHVNIKQMLVLEDSEHGTQSAIAAGACVVSIPNRHTMHGNFKGTTLLAKSLADEKIKALILDSQRETF